MTLKSEIIVDKVTPAGQLLDIKGKLNILKPIDGTVVIYLDPDTGTISNNDFSLGHNDLDIPVLILKDQNGFSYITDQTTSTYNSNNPNKGIKIHTTQTTNFAGQTSNTITLGNIQDGLGSIIITPKNSTNFPRLNDSIIVKSSNIVLQDSRNGIVFKVGDFILGNNSGSNLYLGKASTNKINLYTGSATTFLGSGSRTIVRNNLETLGSAYLRGPVKMGIGSIQANDMDARHEYTHFTHYSATVSTEAVAGSTVDVPVYVLNPTSTFVASPGYTNPSLWATEELLNEFNAGFDDGPYITLDSSADVFTVDGTPYVFGTTSVTGDPDIIESTDTSEEGFGKLTIQSGKGALPSDGVTGWINSASGGEYGDDVQSDVSDYNLQGTDPNLPNYVSVENIGRDNQPSIMSRGSLTIGIDGTNTLDDGRFFEVMSGISNTALHPSQRSLLTITPSNRRTWVYELSASKHIFASTSLSDNESNTSDHKTLVVDTSTGKFFHKGAEDESSTFLKLTDTPTTDYNGQIDYKYANLTTDPETGDTTLESFASYSIVISADTTKLEFVQAVPSASFALTASHLLGGAEGVGFPYAGSDDIAGNPAQAIITGSLFLSGSGNITASGAVSASLGFTGSLYGTASWAVSSSQALTASYLQGNFDGTASWADSASNAINAISASYVSGVLTGSLYGTSSWAVTSSYALEAASISGDFTVSDATNAVSGGTDSIEFHIVNNGYVDGDLNVSGALGVAESITLADITFSSSAEAFIFGSGSTNGITHQMTGNLALSGTTGITANMSANTVGFIGTASWAQSASNAITALSASFAETASFFDGSVVSASFADSSSLASNADSASNATNAISASLAETASFTISSSHAETASYVAASNIDGQVGFPFIGSAQITGSLLVSGTITVDTPIANTVGVNATSSWAMNSISASYISGVLTGSLEGTASWAYSASNAITASYISSTNIDGQVGFPFTGSAAISGNLSIDGPNGGITASQGISASGTIVGNQITGTTGTITTLSSTTATLTSITASSATGSFTGSFLGVVSLTNLTASSATGSFTGSLLGTASYATTADSIANNSMLLTQLLDVPDNGGAFDISNDNNYPPSHEGYALVVSGNNSEMEFVQAVPSSSHALSASHTYGTASYAITASFALNTTPSPTAFTSLTDVVGVGGDDTAVSYANIAWGPGSQIIYTTAHTGSFTGSFDGILTGSVHGTASWAESASVAITASYVDVGNIEGVINPFPFTGSAAISGNLSIDGPNGSITASQGISASNVTASSFSGSFTGSLEGTASWATQSISSSYLDSFLNIDNVPDNFNGVGDYVLIVSGNNEEVAFVQQVQSASLAETASYIDIGNIEGVINPFPFTGSALISGNLSIEGENGSITASQGISASNVTASSFSGSFTGSLFGSLDGTASWAHSSSNALNAISASYVSGVLTGSLYGTASWAVSASYALTASYLQGTFDGTAANATIAVSGGSVGQPFHIVQDGYVNNNLIICGSLGVAESITLSDITISASSDAFIFGSGSGNDIVHQMTGNLELSASSGITANMDANVAGFIGTASWAHSASIAITSSYAISSSYSVSASLAETASYIDASNIANATGIGFPYAGSDELAGDPAQAVITGSLFLSGSGYITASNISASDIIAKSLQIDNAQKISALDTGDAVKDIAFISDQNITTFGNDSLATKIIGEEDITLDSEEEIYIDSDTGVVEFQDNGVTSITFDTTNGAITASGGISASVFSASNANVGFYGTASWAVSASQAITASYFEGTVNGDLNGTASWADSASNAINAISASYVSGVLIGNLTGTSSWADSASNAINSTNAVSASYVSGGILIGDLTGTASWAVSASQAITASYLQGNFDGTASWAYSASNAVSASQAQNAVTSSYLRKFTDIGDTPVNYTGATSHSVVVKSDGLGVEFVSIVQSASNAVSASQAQNAVTASYIDVDNIEGDFTTTFAALTDTTVPAGTAEDPWPNNSIPITLNNELIFTSSVPLATTADTASYFDFGSTIDATASWAESASNAINAISASYVSGVLTGSLYGTSSWAVTASHVVGETNPFPFTGFAVITGSLELIGISQSSAIGNNLTSADLIYLTSSIQTNTGYDLYDAFDNDISQVTDDSALWFGTHTSPLTIDYDLYGKLGYSPVIDRVGLVYVELYKHHQTQILGSDSPGVDGWTTLATEDISTDASRSFAFNNIAPYKWYRFSFTPSDTLNNTADTIAISEIALYSDQGSVTANNFYGPLMGTASWATAALTSSYMEGTASWAYSASQAITASYLSGDMDGTASWAESASNAINAVSASYVSGVLTGSLYGTASWAYSASQALFASESLGAISASYVSGVLTGSLYGTASWAVSASQAITASYLQGTFDGTASWADSASNALFASESETIQVSLSDNQQDSPIIFSLDTTPAGEFVSVYADPSMSYNAFTDTFNVPNISSSNITASVISSSQFTGSLYGTASWAITASHALNGGDGSTFPYSGSDTLSTEPHSQALITGSLYLTGSGNITSSGAISASMGFTGSLYGTASWALFSSESISASYAESASWAIRAISGGTVSQPFHIVNNAFISGTLFVSGNIATAESITIHDVTISQSGDAFVFGSGSLPTILHQMTGGLSMTSSTGISYTGSANTVGFHGTASWAVSASQAITASYLSGDMEGTASWAYSASNALNSISASYVSGVLTGSLYGTASWAVSASQAITASYLFGDMDGTASWAYSASNALFASESLTAISASYISGVLIGDLTGTASWAYSASNAINAISASYVSGVLIGDLTGTASWAENVVSASFTDNSNLAISSSYIQVTHLTGSDDIVHLTFVDNLPIMYGASEYEELLVSKGDLVYSPNNDLLTTTASYAITASYAENATTNYLDLTDTLNTTYEDKNLFVPIVKESTNKLILVQTVPSASYAVTASYLEGGVTVGTSELATNADNILVGPTVLSKHRLILGDESGFGYEPLFSPKLTHFIFDQVKGVFGFNIEGLEFEEGTERPQYSMEVGGFIRIQGEKLDGNIYTTTTLDGQNSPPLNPAGSKYHDVGIVLRGNANAIYHDLEESQDDNYSSPGTDLVRLLHFDTSKKIISVGKNYQEADGLHLFSGQRKGPINFTTRPIDASGFGSVATEYSPPAMVIHGSDSAINSVGIKGDLTVGSTTQFPGSQLSIVNPNNTSTYFGINVTATGQPTTIELSNNGLDMYHEGTPSQTSPINIHTGGVTPTVGVQFYSRLHLNNKSGNIILAAEGVSGMPTNTFKLKIEGTSKDISAYPGTQDEVNANSVNELGRNDEGTGRALHVDRGISHFENNILVGSKWRPATNNDVALGATGLTSTSLPGNGEDGNINVMPIHSLGQNISYTIQPEKDARLTVNGEHFYDNTNNFALHVIGTSTFTGEVVMNEELSMGADIDMNLNDVTGQSDRRSKKNIKSVGLQLDNVLKLNPVSFIYKADDLDRTKFGLIAQEVQEIYPELVKTKETVKLKDSLSLNYQGVTPMLIKAIQEQQELIEKLSARIDELEKQ